MASYTRYLNLDATGANDGTSEADGWNSWFNASSGVSTIVAGDSTAQVTLYVKRATTPETTARTFNPTDPAAGGWILIEGYKTTPGDGGNAIGNFYQHNAQLAINCFFTCVRFIDATSSSDSFAIHLTGYGSTLDRCRATLTNASGTAAIQLTQAPTAVQCHAIVNAAHSGGVPAVLINSRNGGAFGCIIEGGVTVESLNDGGGVVGNLITSGRTAPASGNEHGVLLDNINPRAVHIHGNTIYGMPDDGVRLGTNFSTNSYNVVIAGNIIYGCGGYAVRSPTMTDYPAVIARNFWGGNTSGNASNIADSHDCGNVVLTADPFTDAAGGDFSLNNTAGGGALIRSSKTYPAWVDLFSQDHFYTLPGISGVDWAATAAATPTVARSRSRL